MWPKPCGRSSRKTRHGSQGGSAIDLLHLIDRLEELVGEARRLPIGTGIVIDRRRLLDLVDQLRATVPAEVREAGQILSHKEEVLAQTDEEVALRLARADEEVERRVSESEIVQVADVRAEQIAAQAQSEADRLLDETREQVHQKIGEGERLAGEQMEEADRYALEMLRKLEQQLNAFLGSVQAGVEALEHRPDRGEQARYEEPVPPGFGVD